MQTITDFNLNWARLDSAMRRERKLKEERDSDKAQIEVLNKEVESLKSGGLAAELEKVKKRSEEQRKMLAEVSDTCKLYRVKTEEAEAKFEDVRDRLIKAEEVNKALIEHVRTHVPRLRSSRLECARRAADRVRTELVGQAQATLDRARKHTAERLELARLNSLASQVKTQLDMISEYDIEVDSEDVEATLNHYKAEIEEVQLTDFSDEDYEFAPEPSVFPESYDRDIATSPLGEDCGIERDWVLEPYKDELAADPELDVDSERDSDSERDAEVILATMDPSNPRSVVIVEQYVTRIISKVVDNLLDEIADRVINEPVVVDQPLARDPDADVPGVVGQSDDVTPEKDPRTGEALLPLHAPTPQAKMPSSP